MKKTLAIILLMALAVMTLSISVSASDKKVNIDMGEVVIDGVIDEVWDYVDWIPVTNLKTGSYKGTDKTPADYAELNCKALWNGSDTLYVLFVVKDNIIDVSAADTWQRDSVEFYIDEDNVREGAFGTDSHQFRIYAIEGENQCDENANLPKTYTKITDDGYIVEAQYLFTEQKPADGHVIGFDLQTNDDAEGDGTRHACLGWSDVDDKASSDNTVWGEATLTKVDIKAVKEAEIRAILEAEAAAAAEAEAAAAPAATDAAAAAPATKAAQTSDSGLVILAVLAMVSLAGVVVLKKNSVR